MALLALAPRAGAVLDVEDRGPTLHTGRFAMRITNAGIIGNAFFDVGRSTDPSLEFPIFSGQECLNHAELWVGALDERGQPRVSGGPMLEWRPTLDPDDHVRSIEAGSLGTRRLVDDDRDGAIDEERLNGKDDDGDGEIDEDLGLFSQQLVSSEYVDDRPEAAYVSSGGESHHALGLSVHEDAYAWSVPGYDGIAGFQFRITNHGERALRNVYIGVFADLDSRLRSDRGGHLNDKIAWRTYSRTISKGQSRIIVGGNPFIKSCFTRLTGTIPTVVDGVRGSGLPAVAIIPLGHTTDPLAYVAPVFARAPAVETFRTAVFMNGSFPGQGGVPAVDADRYAALAGSFPQAPDDATADYAVLVSCGPFASLAPGQSLEFAVALVAAQTPDSLAAAMANAAFLRNGFTLNRLPDQQAPVGNSNGFQFGATGINGHEVCLQPPAGQVFRHDAHCAEKFYTQYGQFAEPQFPLDMQDSTYTSSHCIWTDADCDGCTGIAGEDTTVRWLDPGKVPPPPEHRAVPADHRVRIEWDNLPEILISAGRANSSGTFAGYRVYRLADWRGREGQLPPRENWALVRSCAIDTSGGATPLASVTDTTLDYDQIILGQKHYPVGRYVITDHEVLNGFDYIYAVTTVAETRIGEPPHVRVTTTESPLVATFGDRTVPRSEARSAAQAWVVPNPFRANAAWDRPAVPGDALTRHIDFMGLPRAHATIKIWTIAGDFVAQIDHDGTGGDGQAAWNLVSRNGQDIESGVYLFTIDSPEGHQIGRFVVIR
jgi:hypothetical protein